MVTAKQATPRTEWVPILRRNPETAAFEPIPCHGTTAVPPLVWRRLNRRFLKLNAAGYFYPLDPMDAYNAVAAELVAAAENLPRLATASPETYLTGAMRQRLADCHKYRVLPVRRDYRAVASRLSAAEERRERTTEHPEGPDVGYAASAAATEGGDPAGGGSAAPLTAQQLAEALPATPSAHERRDWAAAELANLMPHLPEIIRRAFRAYLRTDGDFRLMALESGISLTHLYRRWRGWLATARAIGENVNRKIKTPRTICRGKERTMDNPFRTRWAPAFRKACDWRW